MGGHICCSYTGALLSHTQAHFSAIYRRISQPYMGMSIIYGRTPQPYTGAFLSHIQAHFSVY